MLEHVRKKEHELLNENEILHEFKNEIVLLLVLESMIQTVSQHVHGSALTGHYRKYRTVARLRGRLWLKG